jgi:hypothetical protein
MICVSYGVYMKNKQEYINALIWRLEEIQAEIDEFRSQVQGLLLGIDEKEQQAEYILKLLDAENVELDGDLASVGPVPVSDMAYEVMSQLPPEPMHYRELASKIMAAGKYIPGQDPAANLISHLSRDERFVRTDRGTYALREWGFEEARPAKRSKKRRK